MFRTVPGRASAQLLVAAVRVLLLLLLLLPLLSLLFLLLLLILSSQTTLSSLINQCNRGTSPLAQSGPRNPGKQWQWPEIHSPFPLQLVEQSSIISVNREKKKKKNKPIDCRVLNFFLNCENSGPVTIFAPCCPQSTYYLKSDAKDFCKMSYAVPNY